MHLSAILLNLKLSAMCYQPIVAPPFTKENVMAEKFEYEIKDGCFTVLDTEKSTSMVLCNFTARIVKEELSVYADGNTKCFYHIQGNTKEGELLYPLRLSIEEYDKARWFRARWGGKAELNGIEGENALQHLLLAISWVSSPIPSETVYEQTGVVIDPSGKPKFIYGNGAITAEGIESNSYCNLPEKLKSYRLPDPKQMPDDNQTKEAIRAVFDLLDLSKDNPYLGLVCCLAAIRATTSMFIPIEQFIFLIGPKDALAAGIAEVIQSFFGATNNQVPLVSWNQPPTQLESHASAANNVVMVVDDFIYPDISKRRHEFTQKVDKFLWAIATGLPMPRAKNQVRSLENRVRLNSMVVSASAFAPRDVDKSLHEHGIYVPFKDSDIDYPALRRFQVLAKDGTFARANAAFIHYLLADFDQRSTRTEEWFEKAKTSSKEKFKITDRAAGNMAGLVVGWALFRKFALSKGAITEEESKAYLKLANKHLGSLMVKQKEIYSSNPGQLFIKGLRQALKEGKAYLIDTKTGLQPDKVEPFKVGWEGEKPNGLWIGWRETKSGDVYIRGDLKVVKLINLLPEHDRALFSLGVKKFWKDLKSQGALICLENGRNDARKVFYCENIKYDSNYQLKMMIKRTSKTSKSTKRQET